MGKQHHPLSNWPGCILVYEADMSAKELEFKLPSPQSKFVLCKQVLQWVQSFSSCLKPKITKSSFFSLMIPDVTGEHRPTGKFPTSRSDNFRHQSGFELYNNFVLPCCCAIRFITSCWSVFCKINNNNTVAGFIYVYPLAWNTMIKFKYIFQ
jgi:hypothetical protein